MIWVESGLNAGLVAHMIQVHSNKNHHCVNIKTKSRNTPVIWIGSKWSITKKSLQCSSSSTEHCGLRRGTAHRCVAAGLTPSILLAGKLDSTECQLPVGWASSKYFRFWVC
jgi:hypothetical protein